MNKFIIIVTMWLLASFSILAQDFQGNAEYFSKNIIKSEKLNKLGDLKIGEDKEFGKAFEVAMKKSSERNYTLVFNKQEAVYEENQALDQPSKPTNGFSISIKMSGGGKKYLNTKEKISLEEDEIFGKEFLIEEPLVQPQWELVNETKKIGDYTCMKAMLTIPVTEKQREAYSDFLKREAKKPALFKMEEPEDKIVIAWYTPEIPVSFGPNNYWGLPGLILELNEGNLVILCSKVVINPNDKLKIKRPNVGDKVSQKEFDTIQKKKHDSMKNEDGIIIQSFGD